MVIGFQYTVGQHLNISRTYIGSIGLIDLFEVILVILVEIGQEKGIVGGVVCFT